MKNELAMAAKAMNARHGGISETKAQAGQGAAAAAAPKPRAAPAAAAPPAARPPHPLFGGGGGLGELKSAAKSLNARHGGISETAATSGKGPAASASAPPSSATPARPPHPLMGGGGGMSLQDQIKAKAASRNARVQNGEATPLAETNKKIVPVAAPPKELSLADQIAAKAASRKDRLGYNDPVLAKPEREGPRDVPAAQNWMAPAEKWVSAPPVEPEPPTASSLAEAGPTKTKTKTEKVTKPTTGKRIIRRKIIKKQDGTTETITTIIDGNTGEEINQDGTPVKPLAESTAYETTKTVTKTTTPLNDEDSEQKVVTTETTTFTSDERPAYMPEPIKQTTRVEASPPAEPEPDPEPTVTITEPKKAERPPPMKVPVPPSAEFNDVEEHAPSPVSSTPKTRTVAPPTKANSYNKVKEGGPTTSPPVSSPAPTRSTSVKSSPAPTKKNVTSVPKPSNKNAEGTVVTTTQTVTVTKTFIPAPKKKGGLFSAPPMTKGTSKVVVTTTSSAPGSEQEVTTTTEPKAKRGWFGRKK